jgi:small subunit ribosomal protein S1
MSDQNSPESNESFAELLSNYEREHRRKPEDAGKQIEATVIAVNSEAVICDVGYKTEGSLPLTDFPGGAPKPGDKFPVTIKGRDPEGYYQLSRTKVVTPTDWTALEKAFAEKATIVGTVTAVVKGGLSVDIGVRAFMPASRSGERDAAAMEKLVEQEIRCRIIKLDVDDEDVVVDRRVVLEEEALLSKGKRFAELQEGDTVTGEVRSLTDYGAFIDLGGIDGLLHVGEISWSRINKPADVLSVGQQVEARVIKIDQEKHKVSLSLKQLQSHPWDAVSGKYKVNDRVRGVVTRITEFGAFVEIEPGVEGLIHVSEMSWGRKIKIASDIVKPGETVEAMILGINPEERRISLGLKQALGDPWADAAQRFAPGTVVEGPVTSIMNFGAFVQVAEGIEGMIHVSEISAEKRIAHPRDVLKVGEVVKAQVLAIDKEKRQIKLSMKQLVPTSIDEYIAEHKKGDVVTGRVTEASGTKATVELGEGIVAPCTVKEAQAAEGSNGSSTADLSSLSAMLNAKWKGAAGASSKPEPVRAGQIRSFRITRLDAGEKKIELELA